MIDYSKFFDATSDLICIAGLDGYFKEVNPAFCTTLGYSKDELLAIPFIDLIHPDDRQATMDEVAKQLQGTASFSFLNRYRCRNGEWRRLSWNATFEQKDGVLYGIARDVTVQSVAETALRDSNERLEFVLEATELAVWDCDLVHHEVTHNRRWIELLGYPEDRMRHPLGFFMELIHPDDLSEIQRLFGDCLRTGAPYRAEFRMRHADGHYLWMSDYGRIVERDADGVPSRMVGGMLDISDQRKTQDLLRLQTDAMANMVEGVVLAANDGRILYTNANFDKMFGYERGALIGQPVSICNSPDQQDPEQTAQEIFETLRANRVWQGEILNRRANGTDFWSHARAQSFQHSSYGNVWMALQTDITELRKLRQERDSAYAELQLLSSRLTQEVEALRTSLAREVHDEVGASLTAIRMQLEALPLDNPVDFERRRSKVLDAVSCAMQRCRNLCTSLRPAILDDLSLTDTFRWYLTQWQAANTGVRIVEQIESMSMELPAEIKTDLFRILQELLTNVSRHAGAEDVCITFSHRKSIIELTVTDNGRGLPADYRAGFGHIGIRERLRPYGGDLDLSGSAGDMRVVVRVPVPA